MTNKKNIKEKRTITVPQTTWDKLTRLKLDGGYDTLNEVILVLLGEKI